MLIRESLFNGGWRTQLIGSEISFLGNPCLARSLASEVFELMSYQVSHKCSDVSNDRLIAAMTAQRPGGGGGGRGEEGSERDEERERKRQVKNTK